MYDHTLDAAFAWLDGESLLRAGAACRRWRERASRPEAWRGRVGEVGWARALSPRDAYLRSLNARARWRRRRIAVTRLGHGKTHLLCRDDDWLLYECTDAVLGCDAHGVAALEPTRSACIYDAASARTVATLPVHAHAAALSNRHRRCAAITYPDIPSSDDDAALCELWSPAADPSDDGGAPWRLAGSVTCGRRSGFRYTLQWHDDVLFALQGSALGNVPVVAEWIDWGTGAARSVSRREYPARWTQLEPVRIGTTAFVLCERELYALDRRTPPGDAAPLMTLGPPWAGSGPCFRGVASLGDGRHIATHRPWSWTEAMVVELWDVRAAHAGATPVAELRAMGIVSVLGATARGTVLLWMRQAGNGILPGSRTIVEWNTARGSLETLLVVRQQFGRACHVIQADERRAVALYDDGQMFLLDADASVPA